MNLDVIILLKNSSKSKNIQKKLHTHAQGDLFRICKAGLTFENQCNPSQQEAKEVK